MVAVFHISHAHALAHANALASAGGRDVVTVSVRLVPELAALVGGGGGGGGTEEEEEEEVRAASEACSKAHTVDFAPSSPNPKH